MIGFDGIRSSLEISAVFKVKPDKERYSCLLGTWIIRYLHRPYL